MSVGVNTWIGVVPSVSIPVTGISASAVDAGMKNAVVEGGMVTTEVKVEVDIGAADSNAAPTMTRFTTVLAVRIAPRIRRAVSRMQIFFSHCMDRSYSSAWGHSSIEQNSKIPFFV